MISLKHLGRLIFSLTIIIFVNNGYAQITWNPGHKAGSVDGVTNYSYNQTPSQLVEISPAATPNTGLSYQWERSSSPLMTATTNLTTTSGYTFTGNLTQTYYFRRKTWVTATPANYIYSNIVKITLVSVNRENLNYVREHDVMTTGVLSWQAVDQLAIGQKLQTTTYLDGLGRSTQKVSRETATPVSGTLWGDMVQFSQYDAYGREPKSFLPYTTASQSGKYKTTPEVAQAQYYTTNYNESPAYVLTNFEDNPLKRAKQVTQSGSAWLTKPALLSYDVNTPDENVQIFSVDYTRSNPPVNNGAYPANTLYKLTTTDEKGFSVIEYTNKAGQLILKKVQLDAAPSVGHSGWICTYSIYDDMGLLRYQVQPEGVKYLDANAWSFAGTNGAAVLNEQCFQYDYDDKGRNIWKKAPGAAPLNMIYDNRDRVVFMQDGNQAAIPGTKQWTANLYDELDRITLTTLYNTNKTVSALQSDVAASVTTSTYTLTNPPQPLNDLVINSRVAGIALYEARNSIEFTSDGAGFTSLANDDFTAQINAAASQPSIVTTTTYNNPITSTDLNNPVITTILKYLFYDNYSFDGVKSFNTAYTNLSAYSTADPNVMPIATSKRTISMPTGSKTRVLGSTIFLSATNYYDERGQLIQTLEDNIKSGTDVTTLQHHFDGRVLSSCNDHSATSNGYSNFKTLTKYIFDKLGRVTSLQKQFGGNALKTVSSFDYDDMGRVKTKHLDPGYTAGGNADLESLNYTFNLHNQITGINKDYALKTAGTYNKWGHFFGLYLGYDNKDMAFTNANLLGQVTGQLWNSLGDDAQRKYDYTYDNAGRLVTAAFVQKQHTGDTWSNSQIDFSVNGSSGKITYDLNGNLLTMLQKGVIPGTAAPITIDNLTYQYAAYSNKLQSVADAMTSTTVNGSFGDFKDGANGATPDYVYDANGNLVIDLNKNVQSLNGSAPGTSGISYNFLDKPELIRIAGKGTVKIVYSADGEKLQRAFIPDAGGTSGITTYINGFTYQETATITTSTPPPLGGTAVLSYINFEEGRIRVITPTAQDNGLDRLMVDGNMDLPNGMRGAYDYFVMDYQQNVRLILTEEIHLAANTATMESGSRAGLEESIFGQLGAANEVASTRYAKPVGWSGNTSSSVSRLGTNAGHNTGPNVLQKVMAGDNITASVQYYYPTPASGNNPNFLSTVVSSLFNAISGGNAASSAIKNNASPITSQLSGAGDFINAVQPAGSNPGSSTPQAYLTIIFFDERFNIITATDGGVAQQQVTSPVSSAGLTLGLLNVKAPKNGYVYVYVSNQSNQDVYFDNLNVNITAGNIIEEDHYYAYGLRIAGISSKKLGDSYEGSLKNNYLYNDKELFDDGDLNWYDYGFRNYDAQIGRFTQLDPLTHVYPYYTPYQFAGDEPISNMDLDGLEPIKVINGLEMFHGGETKVLTGIVIKAAPRTASMAAKVGSSLGTLFVSTLKASLSFLNSIATGGSEFSTGVVQGVGEWGLNKVHSAVNQLGLYYNLITKSSQTIAQIKSSLSNGINSFEYEGNKIAEGDFSSVSNELDHFSKASVKDHGKFAGKFGAEAAVAALTGGESAGEEIAAEGVTKLLNPAINMTERGLAHTLNRHTFNGILQWANKSKFFNAAEVESLIKQGTQMPITRQANGNFSRMVNAERNIGIDRATGNPTSIYTIITNRQGNLITSFPGMP